MCGGCILLFSVMLMWYVSIGWCKVGGVFIPHSECILYIVRLV